MPVSKKRKKKGGAIAKFNRDRRNQRLEEIAADQPSGVTLQDLINMVAYQEYQQAGIIEGPAIPDQAPEDITPDFDDPDTAAVIRAVHEVSDKVNDDKENEDGR